jgi:hypothetical protein
MATKHITIGVGGVGASVIAPAKVPPVHRIGDLSGNPMPIANADHLRIADLEAQLASARFAGKILVARYKAHVKLDAADETAIHNLVVALAGLS